MAESPLLVVEKRNGVLTPSVITDAVDALPPSAKAAFFELSQNEEKYGAQKTAEGVWRTNAYPIADGRQVGGIFPCISRINHACVANAHVAWNKLLQRETVHATKSIAAGEEVTVSCARTGTQTLSIPAISVRCQWLAVLSADLEPGMDREQRQAYLQSAFGFDCACALCTLTGSALEVSDARQRRIHEIDAVSEVCPDGRSAHPEMLRLVSEKLKLFRLEGLPEEWGHMDMVCVFARSCRDNNFAAAHRWMRRAIEASRTILGDDSHTVRELEALLDA